MFRFLDKPIDTKGLRSFAIDHSSESPNLYFKGDNLAGLHCLRSFFGQKVDLIYIDPPYASNQTFTVGSGRANTISRSSGGQVAYEDHFSLEEYLEFLYPRVVLAKKLMSEVASIYVHVDYKVGHYVKVLMDEVFGAENFKADISRIKCNPKNFKRKNFGNIKDCILYYTKTGNYIWNEPSEPYTSEELARLFPKQNAQGKRYTTVPLHAPGETSKGQTGKAWRGRMPPAGRHWRCAPDELERLDIQGLVEWSSTGNPRKILLAEEKQIAGKKAQDIWYFKDKPTPSYPTEKNREMLQRIIRTSSNKDSFVMDFFSGSGSFLFEAYQMGRRFIGMDQSDLAFETTTKQFEQAAFSAKPPFSIYLEH